MDIIGAGLFGFGDAKESSGSLKAYLRPLTRYAL